MVVVRNRIIRRRLLWSALFLLVAIVLHFVIVDRWNLETDPALRSIPDAFLTEEAWKIEGLLIVFALLNAIVPLAFNPWFRDQPSDRAPASSSRNCGRVRGSMSQARTLCGATMPGATSPT